MALRLRTSFHQTEVRTVSDTRLGWLADVEIDELNGKIAAIGVESIPRLPLPLHWIPSIHVVSWSEACIRVNDATAFLLKEKQSKASTAIASASVSLYDQP